MGVQMGGNFETLVDGKSQCACSWDFRVLAVQIFIFKAIVNYSVSVNIEANKKVLVFGIVSSRTVIYRYEMTILIYQSSKLKDGKVKIT